MSTDDVLVGLGLVPVLAVSSQLLAARLRLPAIVLLLPAGFLAGIATADVHPDRLPGGLYRPFVSIAVGVVLFEAGRRLSLSDLATHVRRMVMRLVATGVLATWVGVAVSAAVLFDGLGKGVPILLGAILVVSGTTVVLPLLAFTRPTPAVRTLLMWEGVLVGPVGALLGVLVFHALASAGTGGALVHPGARLLSIAAGALIGASWPPC